MSDSAAGADGERTADLFGQRIAFRDHGAHGRPVVLLVHGLGGSSAGWGPALDLLARDVRVIAVDLPGFGASGKERGDYSLGSFTNTLRDLLNYLEITDVTVAGHSMGGGVALMFSYQYPELVTGLVLVSAGGLGAEVTPLLRAATIPGSSAGLRLLGTRAVGHLMRTGTELARKLAPNYATGLEQLSLGFASFADVGARDAFQSTARSIIDWQGQRVSATSRLHLTRGKPLLFIHGDPDPFIPLAHSLAAHTSLEDSTLEVFPDAGHYPYLKDPQRFARLVLEHVHASRSEGDTA